MQFRRVDAFGAGRGSEQEATRWRRSRHRLRRPASPASGRLVFAPSLVGLLLAVPLAAGPVFAHFGPTPVSLEGVPVPVVPGLTDGQDPIVVDEEKAIVLGKALFWDVNVGSDGVACATCHFHAGSDRRVKNQLSPTGKNPAEAAPFFDPSGQGVMRGPNYRLERADFPFHRTDPPLSPLGDVTYSSDDVVSSAGTFGGEFEAVSDSSADDQCARSPDPVFHVGALGARSVEPRNAPTVINAAFNFRNLWDGSANNVFNGSSPWGDRDPDAGVWVATGPGSVEKQRLRLVNSSLASQALGPPLSPVEMGCAQRTMADVARKLACRRPLEGQNVHWDDSVLGPWARSTPGQLEQGLDISYHQLVAEAFAPRYWSHQGEGDFGSPQGENAVPYDQYEANFSMFFALAIQLYESTLISDDSPFDRSEKDEAGIPIDLSESAQSGFTEFRLAHCALCHIGPLLTPAPVVTNAILVEDDPMAFGNQTFEVSTSYNVVTRTSVVGGASVIDTGFASTGVTQEAADPGLGGTDPFGNPLSFSDQYLQWLAGNAAAAVDPYVDEIRACDFDLSIARDIEQSHPSFFTQVEGVVAQPQDTEGCFQPEGAFLPEPSVAAAELASESNTKMRSAAAGSFKIPTLRNVELTGPYMHNGSMATLAEVMEFYTRGGNFDPDAKHFGTVFAQVTLRFSEQKRNDIIEFMKSLTDDRVRYERAPFDHPELPVPHGHSGDHVAAGSDGALAQGLAADEYLLIPAVGAAGRSEPLPPFDAFLAPCEGPCEEAVTSGPPPVGSAEPFAGGAYCVPEPAAGVLQAAGLLVLAALHRRKLAASRLA